VKIRAYERFKKEYQGLPKNIQKKVDKQITILEHNFEYPSLHTKRIKGREKVWEARVDDAYRLTFEIIDDTIFLRAVGNHDEALKRP